MPLQFQLAREAVDRWLRVIEAEANGKLHDPYVLQATTGEVFDRVPAVGLVAVLEGADDGWN